MDEWKKQKEKYAPADTPYLAKPLAPS